MKHDPTTIQLPAHYPDTQLVREDFARYYDEIAHFDVFFGEVMAELEKRGLASNSIVNTRRFDMNFAPYASQYALRCAHAKRGAVHRRPDDELGTSLARHRALGVGR